MALTKKEKEQVDVIRRGIAAWHAFVTKCENIAKERVFKEKEIDLSQTMFGNQSYRMVRDGAMYIPMKATWNDGIVILCKKIKDGSAIEYHFEDMAQDAITLSDFMHAIFGDPDIDC